MKNEIYYSKILNPAEKMALSYILKGCKRQKFIAIDVIARLLCCSRQTASKVMKSLEDKNLIKRMKPDGAKYYIIVVLNNAFEWFCPNLEICENQITKDKDINCFAELQAENKKINDREEIRRAQDFFKRLFNK